MTSATSGLTTIEGTLSSTANTTFRLEFFANTICDPSGFGEGEKFLGSTMVTTNGGGDANFTVTIPTAVPVGQFITSTATNPGNNTSEFSKCAPVVPAPFADFTDFIIDVEIEDDEFEVEGAFTLGGVSDGIDLLIEDVTLTVGTFSTTIPAGSLELDDDESFEFEGTIDGVELEVEITGVGDATFEFEVEAEGANLNGTVNPVEVTLSIGDDIGTVSVIAELEDDDD